MGAAYGTAKSGVGVASMGVMRPELVMKSIVPVVMAGVLGIYGLIIAVIISTGINPKAKSYYLFDGYAHLSSGLACGLAGLSAGMAIGIVGDAGVSSDNDVGKGGSALHLYWRQRNCRAMPTQMQSGTDADAERRRLCRPLPSPHLSSSLSSTIATCSPQRRRRSPLLKR
ncbi:hypothetical protein BHM03_00026350 [Ensete ventricosum]|nr:hypothetical protein BHM03_00026350 [Ensete ventricosum]